MIELRNKRKHVVTLPDGSTIEPLGSVDIDNRKYQEFRDKNKHFREAVNLKFLSAKNKKGGRKQ